MKMRKNKLILLTLILIMIPSITLSQRTKSSQSAGEQRNAEKGLKDNRYFFYFINPSISNLGTDEEKKIMKESIQRDMISQLLYMKFLFHESFIEIRKSQELMINIYRSILRKDIDLTKKLLNGFAPEILRSGDAKAKHYLRLGYRDIAVADQYLLMADHYRETLYSLRLYKYVKAIKKAKHGKRYAFLAAIEGRTKIENKKELSYLTFSRLTKVISDRFKQKKDYYTLLHFDNYYKSFKTPSYYDKIWFNPNLHEVKEYNQYLKLQ